MGAMEVEIRGRAEKGTKENKEGEKKDGKKTGSGGTQGMQ